MKQISTFLCALFSFLMSQTAVSSGLLFNVSATGTSANLSITLCLNGKGPFSCQTYSISASNLTIITNIPNYNYTMAGIKINTPGYKVTGCTPYTNGYCLFNVSNATSANIVLSQTSYESIIIGNPGNGSDPLTGFGAVPYVFRMGKYDVTIQEYTDFLNAVAKTDTYSLYNSNMGSDLNIAGISRSGVSGNYHYSVITNAGSSANRPITYVTWFNAARFANWMANGKPSGAEDSTTTENGAYALNGATTGEAVSTNVVNPNTNAPPTYYIPLENEWYKAAYYNPTLNGGAGGYFVFATQSNDAPGNTIGSQLNQANYFIATANGFAVTQSLTYQYATQNYLTDVGAFSSSGSYYGTFDQNGNVDQWNDLDGSVSLFRGLRGGFYFSGLSPMNANLFANSITSNAYSGGGFRLASPE